MRPSQWIIIVVYRKVAGDQPAVVVWQDAQSVDKPNAVWLGSVDDWYSALWQSYTRRRCTLITC